MALAAAFVHSLHLDPHKAPPQLRCTREKDAHEIIAAQYSTEGTSGGQLGGEVAQDE